MNHHAAVLVACSLIVATASGAFSDEKPRGDEGGQPLSYHADILPLLTQHCSDCHGKETSDGDYRVDSYALLLTGGESEEPAIVPGESHNSPLVKYLTGQLAPRMPKKRKALEDTEIAKIRQWIDQGAAEGQPLQTVSFSEEQLVFFETDIRPLLVKHCFQCHGNDKANGNLAFTSREDLLTGGTRGPAIVPGQPDASLLIEAVRHAGQLRMPKNKPQLDEAEIALLEKWINMDAPWPPSGATDAPKIRRKFAIYDSDRQHWAFQPVVRPEVPKVEGDRWCRDDMDRFVLAKLEEEKIQPAPRASRRLLMRRISFDLTGLPPTLADLEQFGKSDSDSTLIEYVDKLLHSSDFGDHWARHWLDHVRYRPSAKKSESDDPYRQWVSEAFHEDMPYDHFLKMQIAGDLLPAERADEVHLDGLIAVRPWSLKSRHDDQIDLLGRTFMGLSLFCARCHDHKLEPIGRDDFFAIQGIFESSQVVSVPLLKQRETFDEYMAGLTRTQANETRMKKELKQFSAVASLVDVRARLVSEREKLDDPKQNQEKIQQNIDKLLAEEQKRLADIEKKKIDLNAPQAREYMQLKQENNEFAARWKNVYQLDAFMDQTDPQRIVDAVPPRLGAESDSPPTDPPVPRRFPTILAGFAQIPLGERTTQSGRLELAQWLADAEHPITARLMTNRIWYYLMGEGLTPSLSNFGRSGQPPSHPELLDYLSDEFVASNWSMKQLIRRIVLSSTYQQASQIDASPDELERREQRFAVARRKRLEVESIYRTLATLEYDDDAEERRRDPPADMVSEMRLLFDGANRDLIVPRRTASVSPLQALFLMNNEHVKASTERIAARLHALPDDEQRIGAIFLLLYSRQATQEEVEGGLSFLDSWDVTTEPLSPNQKNKDVPPKSLARWQAYLQILIMTNEFLFVD